jgi:hypothetical protein
MKRHLCPALALLVAFLPVIVNASPQNRLGAVDVTVASAVGTANQQHATSATAHLELFSTPSGPALEASVVSDGKTAIVRAEPGKISFSDGYELLISVLADNGSETVTRVSLTTPAGSGPSATVRVNKTTGRASQTGMDGLLSVLNGSADVQLLRPTLPAIVASLKAQDAASASKVATGRWAASSNYIAQTDGWFRCTTIVLVYIVETALMVAACGAPEPGEPFLCGGAIFVWVHAGYEVGAVCRGE